MRVAPEKVAARLAAARAGNKEALGETLAGCRLYLMWIARKELDPALRAKVGASDLVQDTLLEVYRDFERFAGGSEAELLAWLRRLLRNNLLNLVRTYRGTAKRDIGCELPLDTLRAGAAADAALADPEGDPAREAAREEEVQLLREAVARLRPECREILALWNEGRSFEEIGRLTGLSPSGARARWLRAIQDLQRILPRNESLVG